MKLHDNIQKIEVDSNRFVLIDKTSERKIGDTVIAIEGVFKNHIAIITETPVEDVWKKIVATSANFGLEGLPNYIEWLSKQEYPESYHNGIPLDAYLKTGFIKGYQTAEKELPTWDELFMSIRMAKLGYSQEQIIEQIKQQKQ